MLLLSDALCLLNGKEAYEASCDASCPSNGKEGYEASTTISILLMLFTMTKAVWPVPGGLQKNLNASKPSEHPPNQGWGGGQNV